MANEVIHICTCCGAKATEANIAEKFYMSDSNFYKFNNRSPICKDCVARESLDNDGKFDVNRFKKILVIADKPFLSNVLDKAKESATGKKSGELDDSRIAGQYMRLIVMPQYRGMTYFDGEQTFGKKENEELYSNVDIDIEKLKEHFGYGYTTEEYKAFWQKRKKLIKGYSEKTALHTERLNTYIIHKVKGELAAAANDISGAEKWEKLAQADATAAKLNVSQLSKSDITGGIDLIPQLVEAVEEKSSLISIMPKLKAQPYDDADIIIWGVVNKLRRNEDKTPVSYREIWDFYDEMIKEEFKRKGYSEEEVNYEIQQRIKPFKDLGEVYKEPLYTDSQDEVSDDDVILE